MQRQSLVNKQDQTGYVLFVKNDKCDLNNHENNDSKPFYAVSYPQINKFQAYFSKIEGENALCSLTEAELKECRVPELKNKNFPVKIEHTLEYSKIAEDGTPDMVDIDELNNATLLYNLSNRYKKDEIYTYVGPILLALNPFKGLPHLAT